MKTLLIITGPQGSGNHLFSKIFALHPEVFGWSALLDQYWIGHDREPFAEAWHNPALLKNIEFNEYAVTSISAPYAYKGVTTIPNYKNLVDEANRLGYVVKVVIIGRDKNILKHQQLRVRDRVSVQDFESQLPYLNSLNPVYISQELLYLYSVYYLQNLSTLLNFPIETNDTRIEDILKDDANSKYFNACDRQDLDSVVRQVSGLNIK
jgi:hypothetical protein